MEYLEAVKRTWSDIQEAQLPPELYEPAFNAGVRYYTGTLPTEDRSGAPVGAKPSADPAMGPHKAPRGDAFARLSAETGAPRTQLEEVLYFNPDGAPGINGGPRRLGKSNTERTRTIALLLASARHFANDEVEISVDQIREVCQQFGVYDVNNFATHVSGVPGFILSGPRTNRVLRAKGDAAARFRQRVAEVLGASDED